MAERRLRIVARFELWACSLRRRAVFESGASPNFGGVSCFRTASQLMLIRDSIDRTARVGSTVAVALACGAFLACRDRVCVISRGAPCGGVPGGVPSRVTQLTTELPPA